MKMPIELLLSFSSFSIHNSSFSFTYPLAAGGYTISWQYDQGNYSMDWLLRYSMILSNQ
jgi:hypothetical protein